MQRFGASNTDQWSTTRPGECYEGTFKFFITGAFGAFNCWSFSLHHHDVDEVKNGCVLRCVRSALLPFSACSRRAAAGLVLPCRAACWLAPPLLLHCTGVYVWSGVCAERRCAPPPPHRNHTLEETSAAAAAAAGGGGGGAGGRREEASRGDDVGGGVCAHNGSCWVFPPKLSALSALRGPSNEEEDGAAAGAERGGAEEAEEEVDDAGRADAEGGGGGGGGEEGSDALVKECVCPSGWWGAECRRLDLCVMADHSARLPPSKPRCMHGAPSCPCPPPAASLPTTHIRFAPALVHVRSSCRWLVGTIH